MLTERRAQRIRRGIQPRRFRIVGPVNILTLFLLEAIDCQRNITNNRNIVNLSQVFSRVRIALFPIELVSLSFLILKFAKLTLCVHYTPLNRDRSAVLDIRKIINWSSQILTILAK